MKKPIQKKNERNSKNKFTILIFCKWKFLNTNLKKTASKLKLKRKIQVLKL